MAGDATAASWNALFPVVEPYVRRISEARTSASAPPSERLAAYRAAAEQLVATLVDKRGVLLDLKDIPIGGARLPIARGRVLRRTSTLSG